VAHATAADEIVVLELTDGSTFISSVTRLRDALRQSHPELIGPHGEIELEQLRAHGAASRGLLGDLAGGLISKVFTLVTRPDGDAILDAAFKLLKKEGVAHAAELGVSWLGTKALMAAIESRLKRQPGLYRWTGAGNQEADYQAAAFATPVTTDAPHKPMLVFVHGTASSSYGSFGDLRGGDRDLWSMLERQFGGGIYAFEHRSLSQSPIENALALVQALPPGAHVSLVSHSRGGLVADLLCLGDFDALIDSYAYAFEGTGDADPYEAKRVIAELETAHAQQRVDLRALGKLLRERQIVVQRYVRTASPANGNKLASANFDLFLSGLLTLIGQVPFLFGSPFYSAFKRVVIEIAKNRTNAHLVPGIEAMLPGSPMARFLRDAPVREGTQMAVIAGDIEGGNLLKRIGVLLTDFVFFDNVDKDLVVDTAAMLAGIAPRAGAKVLFDRGADVSHFRYFTNLDTRTALRDWLVAEQPSQLDAFRALPDPSEFAAALQAASTRDAAGLDRPVVVILPGVMGSHLKRGKDDRVWFDPLDIAAGGLSKIAFGKSGVEADDLFEMFYGKLCKELSRSQRVERFAYDWRQPMDLLAERLGALLERLLQETKQPIRLLAHSMGGLVCAPRSTSAAP
jgi:pimeloyl-ACP methyl ester carboxylesterase